MEVKSKSIFSGLAHRNCGHEGGLMLVAEHIRVSSVVLVLKVWRDHGEQLRVAPM